MSTSSKVTKQDLLQAIHALQLEVAELRNALTIHQLTNHNQVYPTTTPWVEPWKSPVVWCDTGV